MQPAIDRRKFLLKNIALGAAAGLAGNVGEAAIPAAQATATGVPRKKLIAWGGIDWYSPEKVQMNVRTIEELPFDGMVLQGFKTRRTGDEALFDWQCFGDLRYSRDELAPAIETLANIDFRSFTNNLLRFNVTPGNVDWFDDFTPILENARLWAAVARETGMQGWAFDVEDYKGTVFNYAKMKHAERKTFDEYGDQARRRGREFMAAVQDAFPQIKLLLMLGHSYVLHHLATQPQLAQQDYGLLPAFLNGMIEAAGPDVTLIDGQEQSYGYLTAEDFYRGYHSGRQRALTLVPNELHADYRRTMDIGMAIYVNYALQLDGAAKGPPTFLSKDDHLQLFEHNIYYALATTDEYAWCYGERIGWWESGYEVALPDGALDAIRSARKKLDANQPLGFDMYARIAEAKRKMVESVK